MATVFDSHFAAAGFPQLIDNFGESITYYPNGGGARPIQAIVDREPPAIMDAAGNAVVPRFIVRVFNSCRSGIASNEIDTGKDELQFAAKVGEVVGKRHSIGQIISQDSGVLQISVI